MGILDNLLGKTTNREININGKILKINTKSYNHFISAINYYKSNNLTNALSEIENSILIEPKNPTLCYYKGYFLEEINSFKEAINFYKESLDIDPSLDWIHYRLGVCYQQLEDYEKSTAHFSKSIENFKSFIDSLLGDEIKIEQLYNNRAVNYANLGISDKCIEDCSTVIKLSPNYPNAYMIRAFEYIKNNQMNLAELDFKKASALGIKKADNLLETYFPSNTISEFEKIKTFADSHRPEGSRPRESYINDIHQYLTTNEITTYDGQLDFCKRFLNEIWAAYRMRDMALDNTNKAYITCELVVAMSWVFKSTSTVSLFDDLMNPFYDFQ